MKRRVTITEMAEHLGKSRQAVSAQARKRGIKRGKDGMYDSAALLRASAAGDQMDMRRLAGELPAEMKGGGKVDLLVQKTREQIRKLKADADTAEHHLARLRGEVMPAEEYRARCGAIAQAFRRGVDVWIKTTSAEVGDPEIKRRLEDARRKTYAAIRAEAES